MEPRARGGRAVLSHPTHMLAAAVARTVAPALARRWLPGVALSALLVGWLWIALPIADLRRAAVGLSPTAQAGVGLLVLAAQAALMGPRLGEVLVGREQAWLRRQPPGGLAWSWALAPWLLVAALPGALPALLWPWPGAWLLVSRWAALGGLLLLAAAGGARGWLAGLGMAIPMAGLCWFGALSGTTALLATLMAVVALFLGAGPLTLVLAGRPGGLLLRLPGRACTPMEALVRRDLLALLRRAPGRLLAVVLLPLPFAGLLWAFRARGELSPEGLLLAARVLLAVGSFPMARALGTIVELRGGTFDPPHEPVSPRLRVAAFLALATLLLAPGLALALVALRPGTAGMLSLLVFCAALGAGAAGIAAWSRRRWRASAGDGVYMVWASFMVALASASPPLGSLLGLTAALGVASLSGWRLAALRRRIS